MICCFRGSSRRVIQTGVSEAKIISLYLLMVSLMASSSSSFIFIQFRRVYLTFLQVLTVMSCSFIISFATPGRLQKYFDLYFTPQKIHHHHITQHATLLLFCIGVFTLFNIHLRMIIFALFVDRINLSHCCCTAIHAVWNILTMKICFYVFFPRFQLTIDVPPFSFYRFCRQFFK